ncbi:hypothetical protein PPTG_24481 [Phytophthora nicotianae INRA-310]|uniref:Uncharacterized protein n=1 Tax=Phytophthora nicotianae (strain INRA-310) TaxID=761204 RepID=W2PDI8_PHYN3|nr:hypothetical protein PPTG_24481 [Phytophthora nicotianae INRA-310]ETM99117.1 hypothetical protein PPTG_24481 [Phytophthora nicotianae INRA-310]
MASETCRTQRAKMLMSGGRRRKRLSTSARRMVLTLTRLPANWARNELVKKNSPYYDGAHCIEMIPAVHSSSTFVFIVFWVSHASSAEFSYFGIHSKHGRKSFKIWRRRRDRFSKKHFTVCFFGDTLNATS